MRKLLISELISGHRQHSDELIFNYFLPLIPILPQEKYHLTLFPDFWSQNKISLPISSSGTTGKPKDIDVSISDIAKSITRSDKLTHWLTCYDYNKMAGIQVVIRSLMNNIDSTVTFVDSTDSFEGKDLDSITNLSLTPSFLKLNLRILTDIKRNYHITLGGEVLTESTYNLIQSIGNHKITNIYATSELGVICKSDSFAFPITAQLDIIDSTLHVKRNGRKINTGDLVELIGTEKFKIIGRSDLSVNIGGRLVTSDYLQGIYEENPLVELAKVSFKKNSVLGHVILLDVLLTDGGHSLDDLKRSLKISIPKMYRPTIITELDKTFKLSANGKR